MHKNVKIVELNYGAGVVQGLFTLTDQKWFEISTRTFYTKNIVKLIYDYSRYEVKRLSI